MSPSHPGSSIDQRIHALLHFCRSNNITVDPRIQIVPSTPSSVDEVDNAGMRVIFSAVPSAIDELVIPEDTPLTSIPKSAILSTRQHTLSYLALFRELALDHVGPGATISLATVLYIEKFIVGERGRWWDYVQSMPDVVDLPLLWLYDCEGDADEDAESALNLLERTEVGRSGLLDEQKELLDRLKRYYNTTLLPVLSSISPLYPATHTPSLKRLLKTYTLISSRAFIVDTYHGLSMVPIADAFNHEAENDVQMHAEHGVCPECGSLRRCEHDDHDERTGQVEDTMDLEDTLEMTTVLPISISSVDGAERGQREVFNTYGATLASSELLVRYGFVLDANPHDVVSFSVEEVFDAFGLSDLQDKKAVCLEVERLSTDLAVWAALEDGDLEPSPRGAKSDLDLHITSSTAQLSLHLLLICFVLALRHHRSDSGPSLLSTEYIVRLIQLVQRLLSDDDEMSVDSMDEAPKSESDLDILRSLARNVTSLCMSRQHLALHLPGPNLFEGTKVISGCEELADALDALDGKRCPRTKMAVRVLLNEWSVLRACAGIWEGLFDVHYPY